MWEAKIPIDGAVERPGARALASLQVTYRCPVHVLSRDPACRDFSAPGRADSRVSMHIQSIIQRYSYIHHTLQLRARDAQSGQGVLVATISLWRQIEIVLSWC